MAGKIMIAFVVQLLFGAAECRAPTELLCKTAEAEGTAHEACSASLLQRTGHPASHAIEGRDINYIAEMFPQGIATTKTLTERQYKNIVDAIHDVYEHIDANVSANFNPRGSFVACLLRTAGHDFMDFRIGGGGGSDGCLNFADSDNAGIPDCLRRFEIPSLYEQFSETVSLADFFVIIAEAAVGRTATGWSKENRWSIDSLEYRFLTSFKYGRETKNTCEFAVHRMPNPENGCEGRGDDKPGLKQIFVEHIFNGHEFPWTLTAAISGAHTVGSAKLENSGYEGAWSSAGQMGKFNNDYFKRLIVASWAPELAVNGNTAKNQWQLADENLDNSHKEMMLTTDMCLVYAHTPSRSKCEREVKDTSIAYFGKSYSDYQGHHFFCRYLYERVGPESKLRSSEDYADLDPTKHMCCAWVAPLSLLANRVFHHVPAYDKSATLPLKIIAADSADRTYSHDLQWKNTRSEICGTDMSSGDLTQKADRVLAKAGCCKRRPAKVKKNELEHECDNQYSARGHAFHDVVDFAREEFLFYKWFVKAWNIATERGGVSLRCVSDRCDVKRDALTAKEQRECPMDTNSWYEPTDEDIKANPSCIVRRVADTKTYHHDNGLFLNTNWYRLNREAIPRELRSKGFDNYNIEDYFALNYKAGGATASSIGTLEFDHQQTLMPPENLIKFSTWKDDMEKNRTWNQVNNYKWTQDGRGSTCWSSEFEKDPWVSLKLETFSRVHKVVIDGLFMQELADKTLVGAQVWVGNKPCHKYIHWAKPGVPTTVVCPNKPWGDEIIVKYEPSRSTTPNRRLILCMVWPYRYDETFHGMINKKR
jgi:hypothetical protein